MEKAESKRAVKAFMAQARRIVNRIDPLDLISTGAPKDEYDDLVGEAARWLARGGADLEIRLAQFVRSHYGVPPDRARISRLAAELGTAWRSAR